MAQAPLPENERSFWEATAAIPPVAGRPLDRDAKVQVAIVGGGFTGLSSAHFLAKAGVEAIVLDANAIGWGASSRNGGYVSQRFRVPFADMHRSKGGAVAARMRQIALDAADNIERMVEELGIDCRYERYGTVVGAHNHKALASLHRTVDWMAREYGDDSVAKLDATTVRDLTGSEAFVGGNLIRTAAAIHPLNFVRGLSRSLEDRGVALHGRTPVTAVTRHGDGVEIRTPNGVVRADHAIIATNAYTGLTGFQPRLGRSLIPFRSALIATARLEPSVLAAILPKGHLLTDTRRLMRYGRLYDGRMLFGGRGALDSEAGPSAYRRLQAEMIGTFPQLAGVPIDFAWSGLVAMTLDGLPHIGKFGDRIHYALGYNGSGVALSNYMGKFLADAIVGKAIDPALLAASIPRIPFYSLRVPAVRAAIRWYQFLDRFN